jgi:hypothetical protein
MGAFVYAADGVASGGDLELASADPRVRENVEATFDPAPGAIALRKAIAERGSAALPGPSTEADGLGWADRVDRRMSEVSMEERQRKQRNHVKRLSQQGGVFRERYLRISPTEALARIAALTP